MNLNNRIPQINSIAILLIIAFILNLIATPLLTPYLTMLFDGNEMAAYSTSTAYASIIKIIIGALLNIIIAIWIFRESKKQNESSLTWTALGLFFGLIAVIAFYLMILIKELKIISHKLDRTNQTSE